MGTGHDRAQPQASAAGEPVGPGPADLDRMVAELLARGWTLIDDFLPPSELRLWRDWALAQRACLTPARVGRERRLDPALRGDRTLWIDNLGEVEGGAPLAARFEQLRLCLNRDCLLGLDTLELHLACYPPGGHYAPHHDRVRDDDTRMLSCVLYLNEAWMADDGGELQLFESDDPHGEASSVQPLGGRLALFLAEGRLHEVRASRRERWSLTGWFRRRTSV